MLTIWSFCPSCGLRYSPESWPLLLLVAVPARSPKLETCADKQQQIHMIGTWSKFI